MITCASCIIKGKVHTLGTIPKCGAKFGLGPLFLRMTLSRGSMLNNYVGRKLVFREVPHILAPFKTRAPHSL